MRGSLKTAWRYGEALGKPFAPKKSGDEQFLQRFLGVAGIEAPAGGRKGVLGRVGASRFEIITSTTPIFEAWALVSCERPI
jgi:hypothetical protein